MERLINYERIHGLKGFMMFISANDSKKKTLEHLYKANLMTLDQICMIYGKKAYKSEYKANQWQIKQATWKQGE